MENLASKGDVKDLGKYIQQSDVRNGDLDVSYLRGISTSKVFIKSLANTTDLNLDSYKLVNNRQFAYVADTSRRGDKIGLAMCSEDKCIVSSIYTVFKVIDESVLLPEFLLLWFKRSDFDRYARFHSWGSARETFNWEEMCSVKLPIPDIETQKSIVAIHHALESRKRINNKLVNMITPLCSVLMKGVTDRLVAN
jgi:type I restriction enzyme S subunit